MMHKQMPGKIGPASIKEDKTLDDYIKRKIAENSFAVNQEPTIKKKLSFEEWWENNTMKAAFMHVEDNVAEMIWKAAQENV